MPDTYTRLTKREAEKYTLVWKHPEYRKVSPGEAEMSHAHRVMGCREGDSLNDYGSGPARATKWFQDQGMSVLGIDIAPNAAETDVPIQIACLWDMGGDVPASDFAFCCDVMEHLPPDTVDLVIREIAGRTRRGAWFRIATRPDVMGPRLINEPLHLTVRDGDWWRAALRNHFGVVQTIPTGPRDAVFYAFPIKPQAASSRL